MTSDWLWVRRSSRTGMLSSIAAGDGMRPAAALAPPRAAVWCDPVRCAEALVIGAVVWGAFAFGAVYPWAYWPLAAAAGGGGLMTLLAGSRMPPLRLGPLVCAFALFATATLCQLVPIPTPWLRTLSPATLDVVRAFDLAAGPHVQWLPLSIAPRPTGTGLALFVSLALLVVGSARLVSVRGSRPLATAIAMTGVVLALVAIVQMPLYAGKIYGFWTPQQGRQPFGPFVNRNHFAGWMTMALPLAMGLLLGGTIRSLRHVTPTARARLVWLATPEANRLVLLAGGVGVMALALVLTLSRSGIASLAVAVTVTALITVRRHTNPAQRQAATLYLGLIVLAVTAWVGVDTVVGRFVEADWRQINGRRGAWADAAAIAASFPLAGSGLNTYGIATLFYQRHDLAHYYSEAHNDYLQLAAEGGVLLIVPALLCAAAFVVMVWRRFRDDSGAASYWIRVGAVTGLGAIALQELVEFSLQMPGNAVLCAVLCGIALHSPPVGESQEPRMKRRAGGVPAGTRTTVGAVLAAVLLAGCSVEQKASARITPEYDGSGRLTLLKYASKEAGSVDTWSYMDGARVVRIESDTSGDGRVDRWEHYGAEQRLEKIGVSRADDGQADAWSFLGADGTVERVEVATRRDSRFNRTEHYQRNVLVSAEEDTDADGKPDRWETYQDARLASVAFDTLRRGIPDRRLVYGADGSASLQVDPRGTGSLMPAPQQGRPSPRPESR